MRETPWIIAIGCAGLLALTNCSQTNRPVSLAQQASGQGGVVSERDGDPEPPPPPERPAPRPRREAHQRMVRPALGATAEGQRPADLELEAPRAEPAVAEPTAPEPEPTVAEPTAPEPEPAVAEPTAPEPRAPERRCPEVRGKPMVYMIGSSTMGTVLGPMLKRHLDAWGVEARRWGKASSGLARPDFHDWPGEVPELVRKYDPDVFVVSLGTNDFQPLKTRTGWIRPDSPEWDREYAARVDRMLKAMNAGRSRTILWIGPTAFSSENARKLAPRINRIMRERVEAFGGQATFIDAYQKTLTRSGSPIDHVVDGQTGKRFKAYQRDGIHLTTEGVRWILAEPILQALAPCMGKERTSLAPRDEAPAGRIAARPRPEASADARR